VIRRVFNLILAAHVLAYASFFSTILFMVGGRKVYAIDVVFAFLAATVLVALFSPTGSSGWGRQPSTKVLALFAVWGLLELAVGIPRFGLSAFGESRLLVLPTLFLFFVVAAYRDRNELKKFVTFAVGLVCVMPMVRGIVFYGLGGRAALVDQFAGSSILTMQAGFRFLQAGEAELVSTVAVGLLVCVAGEADRKRRYSLLALATSLLVVIAVVQVRSAWITSAVGLILASILVARFFKYAAVSVAVAVAALALAAPVGSLLRTSVAGGEDPSIRITDSAGLQGRPSQAADPRHAGVTPGANLQSSIGYSATFLKDPAADVTAAWRLTLWRQALVSATEHPVVGQGLGGYWKNVDPNGAPANQMPHNGYLAVLVKLGGVGLGLLLIGLALWGLETMRFIRHEPEASFRLLAKAVVVAVVMSAAFAFFYDFTVAFWVLLGVGTVLVRSRSLAASA